MDLSNMSLAQLLELQQAIPQAIKRRQAAERSQVLNEVKELAQRRGYSLEQLVGKEVKTRGPKAGVVVPVKYRHPRDAALQWTGRGRQPKWVQEWLANGGQLDALKV